MLTTELERGEENVEGHSVALKKQLGLWDLVLTQIVFVVGTSWVGAAAKLGPSHLVFWLLAILLFYVPQAAVVIYLNRLMPLEGGLYQWAKFGFNEFAGFMVAWNLWLLGITVMALGGLVVTTNISYASTALGFAGAWMQENKLVVSLVTVILLVSLVIVSIRGLSLARWVHNTGGIIMIVTYGALVVLPFLSLARGELKEYRPLQWALPTVGWMMTLNIFSKMAVGAMSGFEYVAILAGECRSPRNIGRSVLVAAPMIALMFILGTSSVLAFTGGGPIDLIGPVPQTLSIGFRSWPIVGTIVAVAIALLAGRAIALTSIYLAGSSRLPMVAGWDSLLPAWFTRLHTRYQTPVNSIVFVGAVTLVLAVASQIGAGAQEAFQLVDSAATVFYGIAYVILFAIPLWGASAIRHGAPTWVRIAAVSGLLVSLLAMFYTIFPIVDVHSKLAFAAKIIAVAVIGNAIGAAIFAAGERKRKTATP